jgi:serine/threonine protein kinase
MTFAEAVAVIEAARVFGDLAAPGRGSSDPAGSGQGSASAAVDAYRRFSKIVHPDVAPTGRASSATAAFAKLSALWADRDGTTMTTKRGTYRVGARVAAGDIADLYAVDGRMVLLKLPRRPADNDLMAAEARALTTLDRAGDPRHRAYAPRLVESFTHEDTRRARRTAVVLERLDGFVSLADVRAAYPGGVDPRDAAWMWRRLLAGLGWAHRAGVVHGAVLPEHVLIHPAEHGLVLIDWCYSVAPGERIPALVAKHRAAYPPEVAARAAATPATDIFMATGLMRRLIKDPPAALRRFAAGCEYDAPRMRPPDAWLLLAEFDELLENLYGPRRFRPFQI